jgi:hypothetical protein
MVVNINSMDDRFKIQLRDQIPEKFIMDSSTDYPDDQACKIRGFIGQFAILIEWHYGENPDNLWLESVGLDQQGKQGECPVNKLKEILEGLI